MPRVELSICRKCWNCGDVSAEFLPEIWYCPDNIPGRETEHATCPVSEIPKWCPHMLEHAVVASVNIDKIGGD